MTDPYVDDPRLKVCPSASPASGGSLSGSSLIPLTRAEAAKGFLFVVEVGRSREVLVPTDRYGGGAVVIEDGRGIDSCAVFVTIRIDRSGSGRVKCAMASR